VTRVDEDVVCDFLSVRFGEILLVVVLNSFLLSGKKKAQKKDKTKTKNKNKNKRQKDHKIR
jgi:hypothetical protein